MVQHRTMQIITVKLLACLESVIHKNKEIMAAAEARTIILIQKPNNRLIKVNKSAISCAIITRTTTSPASVVIVACSSLPDRASTWFNIETIMPIAAILNIRSISILYKNYY